MDFNTEMSEATAGLMENKGFADMNAFAESYKNLETNRGQLETSLNEMKGQFNLPDELTPENIAAMNSKLGVPDDISGYEVKYEGDVELDEGVIDSFKQFAKERNIPASVFNELINFQVDASVMAAKAADDALKAAEEQEIADHNEAIKKAESDLMAELGDKYESAMTAAAETSAALGLDELLEAAGKASDPAWLKQLNLISGKLGEGTLKGNVEQGNTSKADEISKLVSSDAFKNHMDPGHKAAVTRFNQLHGIG